MTDDEKRNEALRWAVTAGTRGELPEDTVRRATAYYEYLAQSDSSASASASPLAPMCRGSLRCPPGQEPGAGLVVAFPVLVGGRYRDE